MQLRDNISADEQHRGTGMGRRKFLAVGGALATTLVAGCSSGDTTEPTGTFRLYISDQPVAIDEFDSLDVTIDGARIFRGEGDAEETETTTNETAVTETTTTETETTTTETTTNETATTTTEPTDTTTQGTAAQEGFVDVDIDDETIDLTTVTGTKAVNVFEGGVPAGSYSSIELSVSEVDGVVDGESVDVKLPSERLRIVKPFEVRQDEPVEFVFDITVVKKGQSGGYNLLPVIGESGVVGEHVEMQEVERERANEAETTEAAAE